MRIGQQSGGHGFASGPSNPEDNDLGTDAGSEAAPSRPTSAPRRALALFMAYVALTKPRVIELLLVTTIPAMLLADRGHVQPMLILTTLFGGMLAAASANSLNMVADADIDKIMARTAKRPLARGAMPVSHAFVFGVSLGVISFFWLWATTNLLSGILAVVTICFYIFVYTLVLKRRTSQNVVWGGAAGCMPVMIGWSAVTGTIGWQAVVMFLVIFLWTPPHTWALMLRYKEDYQAANVPMLPAVASEQKVTKHIVLYAWATVAATLALTPGSGVIYAVIAVAAGAWFLIVAHRLYAGVRAGTPVKPMKLFILSNEYLALVFCGLAVDSVVGWDTLAQLLS
ncbi:protoheme IX farnesyltransferase [Rhodococcus sp. PAMC28707]|uniref:heme o synthase n=1 Tax=unclassified Rhodococcus (in: high G+C Gram-positive bacteria) TaxID=192944 RepID=UPI00109DA36D|nr:MULTISPECIES: heme o synthase [unclassified Rhodococcus (in: high G+C Gram-positive bacteria)]QCB51087.1 protoheme IX farnesyltransferase [Rhodococcus sp. PAMC28705]QCB57222.1 protoheme IX farnesyltransferase [Rhodococcus sp. PAMC28707]